MQDWVASEIQQDDSGCPCIQGWVTNEIQYDDAGCPCNQGWVALPLYFLFRSFSDLGRDPRRSTGAMFADPRLIMTVMGEVLGSVEMDFWSMGC